MSIKIEIDDKEIKLFFTELERKLSDLSPVLEDIKEHIISSIEQNFLEGGRYSEPGSIIGGSKKWEPLKSSTKKQRAKKGKWPGQILIQSGHLASGIEGSVFNDRIEISVAGPAKKYAAIHQFGGKTGKGHKATIPARPFLVLQEEDIEYIKKKILEFLSS